MRLLKHDSAGQLSLTKGIFGGHDLECAILSHTWGADTEEVTFGDLIHGTGKNKAGYNKIQFCGKQARLDGLKYVWVDTCCIDKSNNSELSEAINSMFRWYRDATKCYVFLSDVSINKRKSNVQPSDFTWKLAFWGGRWFTRGWTLQELLAPGSVEFFSQEGEKLGDERSLERQVHETTGIPILTLQGAPLYYFEVDERLSGAENRKTRLQSFLTSRPETPIRLGFRTIPGILYHDLVLHDIARPTVDHDITIFFQERFREIREGFEDLPTNWPEDDKIGHLVKRADGLFIYAATACHFIKGDGQWLPQDLLDLVLPDVGSDQILEWERDVPSQSPTWELDEIYTQVLQRSVNKFQEGRDKDRVLQRVKQVIGSFAILSEPVPASALTKLLQIRLGEVNFRVRNLHSVLNIPRDSNRPIRFLHPSFREFLLDKQRCHDLSFWVDEKQAHQSIASCCISLMSSSLKQDICSVNAPGVLVSENDRLQQFIPPEVKYACLHWIQHLQNSGFELHDNGQVHKFLQVHFLHWLEVLGWIGKTSEGILAISSLEVQIQSDKSPILYDFVHDAKRFALHYQSVIERAPLQLYCSALIFAPEKSVIRRHFEDYIHLWVQSRPKVQADWSAVLTLEGHGGEIWSVAFSPDGKYIISGSVDGTVRLWDAITSSALRIFQHLGWVWSIAFSPDSKYIVSGSRDAIVRFWGTMSDVVLKTLKGHSGPVGSVAFSPDGKLCYPHQVLWYSFGTLRYAQRQRHLRAVCPKLAVLPSLLMVSAFYLAQGMAKCISTIL